MGCTLTSPECFTQDPDIGGPGVRVAFYMQAIIIVANLAYSPESATTIIWTTTATTTGLQIAAIIDYTYGSLTLFQAVQVNNLIWLNHICLIAGETLLRVVSRRSGRPSLERSSYINSLLSQMSAMFAMLFSILLGIVFWAHPKALKAGDYWQDTPFIFFWKTFPAISNKVQVINLVFIGILAYMYCFIAREEFRLHFRHSATVKVRARTALNDQNGTNNPFAPLSSSGFKSLPRIRFPPRTRIPSYSSISPSYSREIEDAISTPSRLQTQILLQPKESTATSARFTPYGPLRAFTLLIVVIYFISMNEILVHRHAFYVPGTQIWGFGQILAIIAMGPSLVTLIPILFKEFSGRK